MNEIDDLRKKAASLGFRLAPLSPAIKQTVGDVRSGLFTARAISKRRGLKISAASMRLSNAEKLGLISYHEEIRPMGGIERIYRLNESPRQDAGQ